MDSIPYHLADIDHRDRQAILEALSIDDPLARSWRRRRQRDREPTNLDAAIALQLYMDEFDASHHVSPGRYRYQMDSKPDLMHVMNIAEHVDRTERDTQITSEYELATELAALGVGGSDRQRWENIGGRDNDDRRSPRRLRKKDPLWRAESPTETTVPIWSSQTSGSPPISNAHAYNYPGMVMADSSAHTASSHSTRNRHRAECVACGDEKLPQEVVRAPCSHEYCRPCLDALFAVSMKDPSMFPPRCDNQEIPLAQVRSFLSPRVVREFEARYVELSTKNKTYCHMRACSAFIPPRNITGEVATCLSCSRTTCTTCKRRSHTGNCPHDEALQELLRTAAARQWQRCYSCRALVERQDGCLHMRCVCGAEFCYTCGQQWSKCNPQRHTKYHLNEWDDERPNAWFNWVPRAERENSRRNEWDFERSVRSHDWLSSAERAEYNSNEQEYQRPDVWSDESPPTESTHSNLIERDYERPDVSYNWAPQAERVNSRRNVRNYERPDRLYDSTEHVNSRRNVRDYERSDRLYDWVSREERADNHLNEQDYQHADVRSNEDPSTERASRSENRMDGLFKKLSKPLRSRARNRRPSPPRQEKLRPEEKTAAFVAAAAVVVLRSLSNL